MDEQNTAANGGEYTEPENPEDTAVETSEINKDPADVPSPANIDISSPEDTVSEPVPEKTAEEISAAGIPDVSAKKERGVRPPKADKADKAPIPGKPKKTERAPRQAKPPASKKTAVKENPEPAPVEPEEPDKPREAPRPNGKDEVVYLNLSDLRPFKNHPFGVRDDAEMKALVESVKAGGVNQPALVRPIEGGGYEIITGHRRQHASELAGYFEMPCIVREMTDDEAVLAMTDDNLRQRSEILPSEKAKSLKMQFEAIRHQGSRNISGQNVPKTEVGKRSVEIVGERNGMNGKQVQRYIKLNDLVPDLKEAMDEKKLGFTSAVEISFISRKNQNLIAVSLDGQQSSPSLSQAQRMRELDKTGELNGDVIDGILCEEKGDR